MIYQNKLVKSVLVVLIALVSVNATFASSDFLRTKKVSPFDEVRVFGLVEVELVQGTKEKVSIKGSSADDVIIKNNGKVLKVQLRKAGLRDKIDARIVITYKDLYKVMGSGGAKIQVTDPLEGNRFEIVSKSGAIVEANVAAKTVSINASEGGEVVLEGEVSTQNVKIASGGYLNSKKTISDETYVNINAGGRAEVFANEVLDVNIRMGGKVFYKGDADVRENIVLGGNVEEVE